MAVLRIGIAGAGLLGRLPAWRLAEPGHVLAALDPAAGPGAPAIAVTVDGSVHTLPASSTVADLVSALGIAPPSVATAVNGEFVARAARGARRLRDGDRVYFFRPITGG